MDINYFSKGGNFPYQAEGSVDDKFFYFRARHGYVSLTLYETRVDMDNMSRDLCCIYYKHESFLLDKEADLIIKKLYKKIKNGI